MSVASDEGRVTVARYMEMAECGIISDDDRVELLEGLIVAMPPPTPQHDSAVYRVQCVLMRKLGPLAMVRVQMSYHASDISLPEPDIAVVPGGPDDYWRHHPSQSLLLVEVSFSSVIQDRLTKSAIYAKAGVPCYWIVNLKDRCVEVFGLPDPAEARYRFEAKATGTDVLAIDAFPDVRFEAAELLPPPHVFY